MPTARGTRRSAASSGIQVLFVAGFGPVVKNPTESRALYADALQLPFHESADEYLHTEELPGTKAFGLWPLSQAADSCFGTKEWPADIPVPQAWLEFDVSDVGRATGELVCRGYRVLVSNRKEPWGQTVTRLLSPEGLLVGITCTPWMRPKK